MDKKFYVTPEMEVESVELVTYMETYSSGVHYSDDPAEDEDVEP